jgi:hypothetical protein
VRADLSPLKGSAQPQTGKNGNTFWKIIFSVEIHFGLTEFRARIKWVDNVRLRLLSSCPEITVHHAEITRCRAR